MFFWQPLWVTSKSKLSWKRFKVSGTNEHRTGSVLLKGIPPRWAACIFCFSSRGPCATHPGNTPSWLKNNVEPFDGWTLSLGGSPGQPAFISEMASALADKKQRFFAVLWILLYHMMQNSPLCFHSCWWNREWRLLAEGPLIPDFSSELFTLLNSIKLCIFRLGVFFLYHRASCSLIFTYNAVDINAELRTDPNESFVSCCMLAIVQRTTQRNKRQRLWTFPC